MSDLVYHYTDTARLPWILRADELQPGRNTLGGFPDPDFLWATTSVLGDRTASASMQGLREGRVRLVRIVLRAEDFEPWPAILTRFPAWTPAQVSRLERAAAGKSRPQDWRCRAEPLPAGSWLAIETKSWADPTWRPLPEPWRIVPLDAKSWGVEVGTKVYASTVFDGPGGSVGYIPAVLDNSGVAA